MANIISESFKFSRIKTDIPIIFLEVIFFKFGRLIAFAYIRSVI